MYVPHFKTNPEIDCDMIKTDSAHFLEHYHASFPPEITGSLPQGPGTGAKQFASYSLSNEATSK